MAVPPSIKGGNLTTEVTALQDTTVNLECEARGVPLPTITWYRKGTAVLSNRQTQYVERGHFLKIPRVQATDAGQYTCKVTSVAGSAEKNYELEVYGKCLFVFVFLNTCLHFYHSSTSEIKKATSTLVQDHSFICRNK